jgi:hypothetical protein
VFPQSGLLPAFSVPGEPSDGQLPSTMFRTGSPKGKALHSLIESAIGAERNPLARFWNTIISNICTTYTPFLSSRFSQPIEIMQACWSTSKGNPNSRFIVHHNKSIRETLLYHYRKLCYRGA